jgi:hypothetical protein
MKKSAEHEDRRRNEYQHNAKRPRQKKAVVNEEDLLEAIDQDDTFWTPRCTKELTIAPVIEWPDTNPQASRVSSTRGTP